MVDRLSIQEGFGHLHAAAAMMCWVTDAPGTLSSRQVPLRFRFHVVMCGALGLGGDLLAMSEGFRCAAPVSRPTTCSDRWSPAATTVRSRNTPA